MIESKQKIAILMATYNGERFLHYQFESLLKQTNQDWVLYIHDDNSTDCTVKIIQEYVEKYKEQIIFLDDDVSFGNATKNFSYMINKISADYMMFCDQDDIWLENKIELTMKTMEKTEYDNRGEPVMVHTDLRVVDQQLNVIHNSFCKFMRINPKRDSLNNLLVRNIATGCTMMINRPLINLLQPIPDEIIVHDWWIALVASSFGKIVFIPSTTILYRQHEANTIGANAQTGFVNSLRLLAYNRQELINYIQQGKTFHKIHGGKLPVKKQKDLETFTNLMNVNSLIRKYQLISKGFLYHNILKNIGLLAAV